MMRSRNVLIYQRKIVRGCFKAICFLLNKPLFAMLLPKRWLQRVYLHLDVSQSPHPSDVIVILGDSKKSRAEWGVRLYHKGYAPLMLVSGYSESMRHTIEIAIEAGVPENALKINSWATSTHNEAQQILAMLLDMDAKSALLVTNKFHTRRTMGTYRHVFGGQDISLICVSPEEEFDPAFWWKSRRCHEIAMEYSKIFYYWIVYGIWSG